MQRTHVGRRAGRLALLAVLLIPALSASSPKEPLSAQLAAFTVSHDAQGAEVMVPADAVKPGDVIEYALTYTNESGKGVTNLEATLPLPSAVEYAKATAAPGTVTVSLDGESFHALPLLREQEQADGSTRLVEVPATEYRALRWKVGELGAGDSITLSARVQVAGAAQ